MFYSIDDSVIGAINRLWPSPNPNKTYSRAGYNQALLIFDARLTYISLFSPPGDKRLSGLVRKEFEKRRYFIEQNQNRTGEDIWRILHTDIEPIDGGT